MIKTALNHALIALFMQCLIALHLGFIHGFSVEHGILAGGIAACAGFLFREIAQHEYKGGGPKNVGAFYGLFNHWTLDSALDIVFPVVATGALWILLS